MKTKFNFSKSRHVDEINLFSFGKNRRNDHKNYLRMKFAREGQNIKANYFELYFSVL